jgi:hypothetical protein
MKIQAESSAAVEFAQYARAIALGRGSFVDMQTTVERSTQDRVHRLLKAAVDFGGTNDEGFAALADHQAIAVAFLESLRTLGAFDTMLSSMRRVPLRTRVAISSVAYTGSITAQGSPKPVGRLTLTGTGALEPVKATAIVVLTEELLRLSSQSLFMNELRTAVVAATDARLVASVVDSNTPSVAASGTDASAFLVDLAAAAAELNINSRSRLFLLVDPITALNLSLLPADGARAFPDLGFNGGDVAAVTVIPTDVISRTSPGEATLLLVDAQQLAGASDTIVLDSSKQASIEMDDAPTTTATRVLRSLWQMNERGLIAHRFFGVQRLTDTAVAQITGAAYEPSAT